MRNSHFLFIFQKVNDKKSAQFTSSGLCDLTKGTDTTLRLTNAQMVNIKLHELVLCRVLAPGALCSAVVLCMSCAHNNVNMSRAKFQQAIKATWLRRQAGRQAAGGSRKQTLRRGKRTITMPRHKCKYQRVSDCRISDHLYTFRTFVVGKLPCVHQSQWFSLNKPL